MSLRKLKRKKKVSGKQKRPKAFPFDVNRELATADQYHQSGNLLEAEKIYRKILDIDPNHAYCLNMLGMIAHQAGNIDDAEILMKKSIKFEKREPGFHNNLALVYLAQGRMDMAAACFREAIKLKPDFAKAYHNLANILKEQGELENAISCYEKTIALRPNSVESIKKIGNIYSDLGAFKKALSYYKKAIAIKPDFAEAYYAMGISFQNQGDFEQAISCYEKAIAIKPKLASVFVGLSSCRKYTSTGHKDLVRCKALLEQQKNLDNGDLIHLHFALGKMNDDCGAYREAFEHYRQGNSLVHINSPFDPMKHTNLINRIIRAFPVGFHEQTKFNGSDCEQPVFIVGMPRSGTSLVEQIIASHPQAHGAGELTKIDEICKNITSSTAAGENYYLETTNRHDAKNYITDYLTCLRHNSTRDHLRITDKMPYNHRYLGWISMLFPKAKIIHCRRHPLDTCLSIYFQNFKTIQAYSYDLSEIGFYYREYERLMEHWRRVIPLPMYEIQYEKLISAPEEKTRELIDFLGLEWDEKCLSFHKTRRAVRTASYWQVRQPIYKKSVQRWKNYEEFLGPLKKSLKLA